MITGEQAEAVGEVRICRDCEFGRHNLPIPSSEDWKCREAMSPTGNHMALPLSPVDGEIIWPKCAERNKDGDCALYKEYVEPKQPVALLPGWRRGR